MIGAASGRRAGIIVLVALAVGIGFGQRSAVAAQADPPAEAARQGALADAASAADLALERLAAVLDNARGHARRGTALTVSGDAPAPELTAAADVLASGAGQADAGRRALVALAGIAVSIRPAATVPLLSYGGPDLQITAAQLRASASAATLFVERRLAAQAVVDALGAALAALDQNQPAAAIERLRGADAPLALLDQWTQPPTLFRYWMKTSTELIDAARGIATATLSGDAAAVKAAAERYGKATEAAIGADNALAVTLSEAGSAVSATPLQRLAMAADEVADVRSALHGMLSPAS